MDNWLWVDALVLWLWEDLLLLRIDYLLDLGWLWNIDWLIHVSVTNSLLCFGDCSVDIGVLLFFPVETLIQTVSTNAASCAAAGEDEKPDREIGNEEDSNKELSSFFILFSLLFILIVIVILVLMVLWLVFFVIVVLAPWKVLILGIVVPTRTLRLPRVFSVRSLWALIFRRRWLLVMFA